MCPMKATAPFFLPFSSMCISKVWKCHVFIHIFFFGRCWCWQRWCMRFQIASVGIIFLQNGSKWLTGWIKNMGISRIGPFISCTIIRSMYLIENVLFVHCHIVTLSFGLFFCRKRRKKIFYCLLHCAEQYIDFDVGSKFFSCFIHGRYMDEIGCQKW